MLCRILPAVVILCGLAVSTASAQTAGGTNVALIDINRVFKEHVRFNEQTEEMKTEVQNYEAQMQTARRGLQTDQERLQTLTTGSPEYVTLERDLARRVADQQVDAELKRKDILEREARVYYQTYQDIQNAVSYFAQQHSIALVLRYDSQDMDSNDRASVLRGVNRAIVFQDRIDITDQILQMVNSQQRQP